MATTTQSVTENRLSPRHDASSTEHSSEVQQHSEGKVARMIEEQTAKVPSDAFLWAAFGSIGGSIFLQMMGRQHESLFVGQWAPTFLILGLYNKVVKVAGSDRTHQ
ncbi:MAG: hypothetical protein WEE51_12950 [Pirellulaceae bacterium]